MNNTAATNSTIAVIVWRRFFVSHTKYKYAEMEHKMRMRNTFSKRVVRYIFWAMVIALAVNAFRIQLPTLKAAKAALLPAKVVPYTVVLQEFHLQRDGTAVPSFKLTQAIRGDGSRAMEMTSSNPASPSSERILDFSSGEKMYVMQHLRLKSTTFDPARNLSAHWLRDSGNNCLISGFEEKPDGEDVIQGYRVVKLTYRSINQWFALDYGCALIKDRAEWPDGQTSEKRLVALIPGEPAPSMFDDPAGFEEVPFSRWRSSDAHTSALEDAYYQSHRPTDATPRHQ
jgi:hypothetical protein